MRGTTVTAIMHHMYLSDLCLSSATHAITSSIVVPNFLLCLSRPMRVTYRDVARASS